VRRIVREELAALLAEVVQAAQSLPAPAFAWDDQVKTYGYTGLRGLRLALTLDGELAVTVASDASVAERIYIKAAPGEVVGIEIDHRDRGTVRAPNQREAYERCRAIAGDGWE